VFGVFSVFSVLCVFGVLCVWCVCVHAPVPSLHVCVHVGLYVCVWFVVYM